MWVNEITSPLPIAECSRRWEYWEFLNMFRVLVSLPPQLFPIYRIYVMLCDFLTKSYDIGGVISVMALSSLFILMTHGLEYPNLYEKLYLLVPSMFMAKHRAKFLQLGYRNSFWRL